MTIYSIADTIDSTGLVPSGYESTVDSIVAALVERENRITDAVISKAAEIGYGDDAETLLREAGAHLTPEPEPEPTAEEPADTHPVVDMLNKVLERLDALEARLA